MILTFKYRLIPTKRQHKELREILESQRELYNAAVEERRNCYLKTGKGRSFIDQSNALSAWRKDDADACKVSINIQRWTLGRLDQAYKGFFTSIKAKHKTTLPRFRSKTRWRTFGFSEFRGITLQGSRLKLKGIQSKLRVHLHRPLPRGASIRSCSFTKDDKGWFVCFQVAVVARRPREIGAVIGIDLGVTKFAHLSDNTIIPNPRVAAKAEKDMRRKQRALSRCKRTSKRRTKVRRTVVALSKKIANRRNTWLHLQSKKLIANYDLIAAENLQVGSLQKSGINSKSICDASWSKFLGYLAYKAERAGKHFIKVDPRNTSQKCSGCGELVPKELGQRVHNCPHCGLVLDRDHNAAINILNAAVLSRGEHNVAQWGERALGNLGLIAELVPKSCVRPWPNYQGLRKIN